MEAWLFTSSCIVLLFISSVWQTSEIMLIKSQLSWKMSSWSAWNMDLTIWSSLKELTRKRQETLLSRSSLPQLLPECQSGFCQLPPTSVMLSSNAWVSQRVRERSDSRISPQTQSLWEVRASWCHPQPLRLRQVSFGLCSPNIHVL